MARYHRHAPGSGPRAISAPALTASAPHAWKGALAEAACCGIPTVVLPVTADPHRTNEHHDNVGAVRHLPGMFTPCDWHDRDALLGSVPALEVAARSVRSARRGGNAAAAAFVAMDGLVVPR